MPLHDHFHPPLRGTRHWEGFHSAWATAIAWALNGELPEGYFAEPNVRFGIEIDVATFETGHGEPEPREAVIVGQRSTSASDGWSSPAPATTVPISVITDVIEVAVYNDEAGPVLVGAIELVSLANKDRPAHRDAFVSKCAAYLQQGVGLLVVDVVTERRANLHEDLLERLRTASAVALHGDLYSVSYRPVRYHEQPSLAIWQETLQVGQPLPTMPLWLRGSLDLPVRLKETYSRTYQGLRIAG